MGLTPLFQQDNQPRAALDDTDIRDATEVWVVGRREVVPRTYRAPGGRMSVTELRGLLQDAEANGQDAVELPELDVDLEIGVYHIQGIATTEELALGMTRDGDKSYFIGPIPVNYQFPEPRTEWPGQYCPAERQDDNPPY